MTTQTHQENFESSKPLLGEAHGELEESDDGAVTLTLPAGKRVNAAGHHRKFVAAAFSSLAAAMPISTRSKCNFVHSAVIATAVLVLVLFLILQEYRISYLSQEIAELKLQSVTVNSTGTELDHLRQEIVKLKLKSGRPNNTGTDADFELEHNAKHTRIIVDNSSNALNERITAMMDAFTALESNMTFLEAYVTAVTENITGLATDVAALLKSTRNSTVNVEKSIDTINTTLTLKMEGIKKEINLLQEKMATSVHQETSMLVTTPESSILDTHIQNITSRIVNLENSVSNIKENVDSSIKKLVSNVTNRDFSSSDLTQLRSKVDALADNLKSCSEVTQKLEENFSVLRSNTSELQKSLEMKQRSLGDRVDKLDSKHNSQAYHIGQLESTKGSHAHRIDKLESSRDSYAHRIDKLESAKDSHAHHIDQLEYSRDTLTNRIGVLESTVEDSHTYRIRDLESARDHHADRIHTLESSQASLDQKLEDYAIPTVQKHLTVVEIVLAVAIVLIIVVGLYSYCCRY